jgi:ArsR family transcriptional regulator, lead/cadmium/zinc/bismuth-responsive transcriptional repressor
MGPELCELDDTDICELADFFKLFGESTRLKILLALEGGELCVNDISDRLGMTMSAVSHQLRSLREAKLIKGRRDGKTIFYSLDDHHVNDILKVAAEHNSERVFD